MFAIGVLIPGPALSSGDPGIPSTVTTQSVATTVIEQPATVTHTVETTVPAKTSTVTATRTSTPVPATVTESATITTTATTQVPVTETIPTTVVARGCPSNTVFANREALVADSRNRRGEVIGTGGKAAISLRFDHYLRHFDSKVLPLLDKYNLPWSQAINAANMGSPKDPWTWNKLQNTAVQTGGEVWNHSRTHEEFDTPEAAYSEVVTGLRELQTNLPMLHIDGWIAPGVRQAMGMQWPSTLDKFTDTFPGQMVLDNHAFVRASFPGKYQDLNGNSLIGQNHYGIEDKTFLEIKAEIDHVVKTGQGLTLMMHPWRVGTSTGITAEDLERTFAYLADLRDADVIEVASGAGILMADSAVDEHHGNLLANSPGSGHSHVVEETIQLGCDRLGVTYEAEVWVQGEGAHELELTVDSATAPLHLTTTSTATGEKQRLSIPVTLPKDTNTVTVKLTGSGSYSGLTFQPI